MGKLRLSSQRSYLGQRALCLPQLDEDPEWDAEHGGQGHEPADAVAPGRVGVDVVVLQRLVLDQEEDEDALQREREVLGVVFSPAYPRQVQVLLPVSTGSMGQEDQEAHPTVTSHTGNGTLGPRHPEILGCHQG